MKFLFYLGVLFLLVDLVEKFELQFLMVLYFRTTNRKVSKSQKTLSKSRFIDTREKFYLPSVLWPFEKFVKVQIEFVLKSRILYLQILSKTSTCGVPKEWNSIRYAEAYLIKSDGKKLCRGYSNFAAPTGDHGYHIGISCSVVVRLQKDEEVHVYFTQQMRCYNAYCKFTAAMIQPIYE